MDEKSVTIARSSNVSLAYRLSTDAPRAAERISSSRRLSTANDSRRKLNSRALQSCSISGANDNSASRCFLTTNSS